MNCNLSPDLQPKLDEIILHRSVFAKIKSDVGKFKEFIVKVDTDTNISPEK